MQFYVYNLSRQERSWVLSSSPKPWEALAAAGASARAAGGATPSPSECRGHQCPDRAAIGLGQGADLHVTQPLARAFQQLFRVRQQRALIEAEIDVAAHGHDVDV